MEAKTKKILIIGAIAAILFFVMPSSADAATRAAQIISDFETDGNPNLTAVPDAKGHYQVGFGSIYNYDENRYVQPGDTITLDKAIAWRDREIQDDLVAINAAVTVPLNNNQLTALVSFVYNVGIPAFQNSTLLQLLNSGSDKQTVADQFDRWIYSDGAVSQGLINRRAKEKALFLS